MAVVSFSITAEQNQKISRLAKQLKRTKSQLAREAFDRYEGELVWAEIRKEGEKIAKRLGIETDDDVERLFGRKASRRH